MAGRRRPARALGLDGTEGQRRARLTSCNGGGSPSPPRPAKGRIAWLAPREGLVGHRAAARASVGARRRGRPPPS